MLVQTGIDFVLEVSLRLIHGRIQMKSWTRVGMACALCLAWVQMQAQTPVAPAGQSPAASGQRQFLDRYCATCHNERLKTGGLSLERVDVSKADAQPEVWEKVVRKLRTGV